MMTLNNGQQEFVNNLLSSLGKNQIPWQASWDRTIMRPYNEVSSKHYQGINELNLWMSSLQHGYDDPRWMTFKQANDKGYRIKKGSVGTYVFNYALRNLETKRLVTIEEYQKLSDEEKENIRPFSKTYKVFNGAQIDGIPALDIQKEQIVFENEKAAAFVDELLKNIDLEVVQLGNKAFYRPSEDKIYLPNKDSFIDEQSFYAVEMHEVAHATSHPTRLNRGISTNKATEQYAIEELKAELSSAFLTLDLGFHFDQYHEDNHTAYIQSWIKQIKENPRVIFDSIKDAQQIRQYMLEKGEYSKIYQQESKVLEQHATITAEGYLPGNLENVNKTSMEEYPYRIQHILQEKESVILFKLGVPIIVQCGYLDKENKYYTNTQLNELTSKMTVDDEFAWHKEMAIEVAGHSITNEEDLMILKDTYAHGYINPSYIQFDHMEHFINTFEYLTDPKYRILDEATCNNIQAEMVASAPLTIEKLVSYKNQYLTNDVLENASKVKQWILSAKHEDKEPLEMLKRNINLEDIEQIVMDQDEYLGVRGLSSPVSDFLIDKMKGNRQLKTQKGADRFKEDADVARDEYQLRRNEAIQEYKDLVKEGKMRPKTTIERTMDTAHGHPDHEATHAARRMLEKRGIDWRTGTDILNPEAQSLEQEVEINDQIVIETETLDHDVPKHNEKETVVINLFAGPGAGKTTCSWEIASKLKKLGFVTEYVPEYAKELVWDNRRDLLDGTLEHQQELLKEQEHRVDRLIGKVDFVVTDAPSLLNLNFLKVDDQQVYDDYLHSILKVFNSHHNFNLFVNRGDTYETTGRVHTLEQSIELDTSLRNLLDQNKIFYGTYNHASVDVAIKNAISTYERFNKNHEVSLKGNEVTLDDMKNSIAISDYAQQALGLHVIKEPRGLYRIDEHDSCKIYPNNTFYRFSRSVGGSIIDFIKHFEECDTKEAIEKMESYYKQYHPENRFDSSAKSVQQNNLKDMELPEKAETNKHVYAYLTKTRGISPSIVKDYINRKVLYEDTNRNCVFTGKYNGDIMYGSLRSSNNKSNFKQDVLGSVKEIGVYVDNHSDTLVVNEAVIDQMSYQSLAEHPQNYSYLSVNGAANCTGAIKFHMRKREEAASLKKIIIGLDNDEAGETNTLKALDFLKENYPDIETFVHLPEDANDFNEQLQRERNILSEMAPEQNNDLQESV